MRSKATHHGTVAITAFIPWILTLAGLSATMELSRAVFIPVHYIMDILFFGVAFGWYFKGHLKQDPFRVMIVAMAYLLLFELIYFGFMYEGELWFLTYVDWVIPVFLIASTIYGVGAVITK